MYSRKLGLLVWNFSPVNLSMIDLQLSSYNKDIRFLPYDVKVFDGILHAKLLMRLLFKKEIIKEYPCPVNLETSEVLTISRFFPTLTAVSSKSFLVSRRWHSIPHR